MILALIVAPPAYLAAWQAFRVRKEVATANGKTLARSVEQTHAVVTRTLGERKTDGGKPPDLPDVHQRCDDD